MAEQVREGQDAATALRPLLTGYWLSQALLVAAELGVADRLADGQLPCGVLAQQVGADEDALYRVLRALAGAGVFTESAPRTFALTALAEPLRTDHPRSVRPLARLFRQEWFWRPWGQLLEAVQTGGAVFEKVHGAPFFAYLGEHPDAAAVFDAAMTAGAPAGRSALAEAYDFAPLRTVVDIGGGEGALLAALLRAHPHLQGILFDQPAVVAGASAHLQAAGVADRCQIVGGDFFAAVPEGDAYVLSQILHDWDDARATVILKNCHRAGHPGARVIAVERVLPPGDAPHPGKLTDLNMLVLLAGRERTEAEYRALFAAAGFELTRSVPLPEGGWSAVEGIRA